jgi:two-component system, NarL family, sensor histidine kinase DesK
LNVDDKIEARGRAVSVFARPQESRGLHKLAIRLNHLRGRKCADYWDFIWIVYSIFFFIDPIERHSNRAWLEFAAFYTLFLGLYTGIILARRHWQSYLCLISMGLLGVIYYPQNNGATGCFIYAAAFLPFIVESVAVSLIGFVLLCIAVTAEGMLLHTNPWSWGMGAFFTFAVGGTNLFVAQKIRANSKLQLAHEEIEQLAKLAERERIARDLHDVLGHTLSVIVLKSELAGRLIAGDPERSKVEITDVEQIARKALGEVREAIRGYRAEGLAAEIKRAQSTLDAAGVTLIREEKPPALKPAEETVMSLVLREAVTNVVRHAQASQCVMRFTTQDGKTALVVEDDGRGGVREEGNGLRGMRERIEALGGRFAIDGTQGTRLTIELPVN